MKKVNIVLLILFLGSSCLFAQNTYTAPQGSRIDKVINTQWTFNYFPETTADKGGYEQPAFDDSHWSAIAIPHTWQTYETTGELHPYIMNASAKDNPYWWNGWGWYRKRIVIGNEYRDKKIFLEFDAVQKYSKIYFNGELITDHKGGFNGFDVDVTTAVKFGEENLLVVAVNNTLNDTYSIPPMNAGNWVVYGGITRDVHLVIKDKLYVPFQGTFRHEGGTFVTTPKVNQKEAVVQVKTFVQNDYSSPVKAKLITIITDADNKIIERMESVAAIDKGQMQTFVQQSQLIKNPILWSPETPYIYNVYTELYKDSQLTDIFYSPLGFRYFHWDYTTDKLWLNGKEVQVHGQNRHEEFPWIGAAFPKWIALRDMNDIRYGLNMNFMRTAHYPHDASIYNFTDRNGIIIDEEQPNIKNQEFDKQVQEDVCRSTIRRDRNHPSIFFWSMGNETTCAADSKWAHEEDTTRIITSRQVYNNSMGEYAPHSEKNMSIEGFLRCTIKGWYDKDEKDLEPTDGQHAGTEVNDVMRALAKNVQTQYGSVWLYADHGADRIYVDCPVKHVNPKGWVDSWRTPKYKYYLWQANFAKKPMVFVQYHFWREQYLGQKKDFMVHSNCDEVELCVNGKRIGKQHPAVENQFTVVFHGVTVEKGTLEAIGHKKDGTTISDKLVMAGAPAKVTLTASAGQLPAGLNQLVEIKADITDAAGVHVIGANPNLKWSVTGPATLVGPDVWKSDRDRKEELSGTMYIDVPVVNLIRSTGKPGEVTVTVSAGALEAGKTVVTFTGYNDDNPVKGITEPALAESSRQPVKRNTEQVAHPKAPQEMKYYNGELNYPVKSENESLIKERITQFIVSENPDIPTNTFEFGYVVDAFYQLMSVSNGRLVADDYNFIAELYNISREITRFIDTKTFPQPYKDELKKYYAKNIVQKGHDENFEKEKSFVSQIPEKGTVVIVNAEKQTFKNVVYSSETDLKTMVRDMYAKQNPSDEALDNALRFIAGINPYIEHKSLRDKKTKMRTDTYTITPDKALLIPDFEDATKAQILK